MPLARAAVHGHEIKATDTKSGFSRQRFCVRKLLRPSRMTDKSVIDTIIAEAGGNEAGMYAVAAVIANRAAQTGLTPAQVVKQSGQFEGYSNPGRGSREAQKVVRLRDMAERAFTDISTGKVADPTHGSTSFRTAGTKIQAPHGTVEIGGNVFAKGSKALDAINAAAPSPQSRPTALAYATDAASTPALPTLPTLPLSNAAMNGVRLPPSPQKVGAIDAQPTPSAEAIFQAGAGARAGVGVVNPSLQRMLAPQNAPRSAASGALSAGAAGNGNIALMPALPRPRPSAPLTSRSVQTVPIDPMTGNPISALQAAVNRVAAERASAVPPRVLAASGNGRGATGASTQGSGSAAVLPPPKVTFYAKDQIANEDAARLGDIIGRMAGTPSAPRSASVPSSMIDRGPSYAPTAPVVPPSPVRVASIPGPSGYTDPNKDASRLQPTTPLAFGTPVQPAPAITAISNATKPTTTYTIKQMQVSNPAYEKYIAAQKADDIGAGPGSFADLQSAVAAIAPPKYLTKSVRVPAVPRPPAAIPLSTLNTVNPASQIVPGLQAGFNSTPVGHIGAFLQGQPVQGGLLSLFNGHNPFGGLFGGGTPMQAARLVAGPAIPRPATPAPPAFAADSPGGQFEKDHGTGSATTSMQNSTRWQTGY